MARVTLALAIVASLAVAAPAARAAGGCRVPKHAKVRATAKHAVAYRAGSRVFACLESSGQPVLLERVGEGNDGLVTRVGPIALAGSHVAYAKLNNDGYSGYAQVFHIDLRHPRQRDNEGSEDGIGQPTVGRIVMAPDGALAYTIQWVYPEYYGENDEYSAVVVIDEVGGQPISARGRVAMKSLVRRHRVVSWTEDGKPRSARFRELGRCTLPRDAIVQAYAARGVVYKDGPQDDASVYACMGSVGEAQLLRRDGISGASGTYRIRGHLVAWTDEVARPDFSSERHVRLYDLDQRRVVRELIVDSPSNENCGGGTEVPDIAIAPNGDLAWIAVTLDPANPCSDERPFVNVWDACGRTVVDDDPDTFTASLRIARGRVLWSVNGQARSAQLRSAGDC